MGSSALIGNSAIIAAGTYPSLRRNYRTVGMYIPQDQPLRVTVPETPSIAALVKDYKGNSTTVAGEAFVPSPETLDSRTKILDAGGFPDRVSTEARAAAHVHRHPALQVGQIEVILPVAPVGRPDQVEQGLVPGNWELLTLAQHPARGVKVAGEHTDLADVRGAHDLLP